MIVRATAKAQAVLGKPDPATTDLEKSDDDWYAIVLRFGRAKCLLLSHVGTLYSVFVADVRVADVRPPGPLLVDRIEAALAAEGFARDALGSLDPENVAIGKTVDRRVLGCMNDVAFYCEVAVNGRLDQLDMVGLHHHLQRHITSTYGYVPPLELVARRVRRTSAR